MFSIKTIFFICYGVALASLVIGCLMVQPKLEKEDRIATNKSYPFFIIHLLPFGALWLEIGWVDVAICLGLYWFRMFFVAAAYHRYFAHRSYKMGRFMQFLMAFFAQTSAQKGALWWAGNHRIHHKFSDNWERDPHCSKKGFLWSHILWILTNKYNRTPDIRPFDEYPELLWLNKHYTVPPIIMGAAVWWFAGLSGLFVGFFLSTVLLYHGTFSVNSLLHMYGSRRYHTQNSLGQPEGSRNTWWLAYIPVTAGEAWHNNHHCYQACARQGFFWWEFDYAYYGLVVLSWFGLVREIQHPPLGALESRRIKPIET